MNSYQPLEAIGEGSFGRVFRGKCLKTSQIVALKFIPKRNKVDRELKSLRRECEIQQSLFHPNIVRMIDSFETERELVAVSEYVPVQLFTILEKFGKLPEEKVKQIACNLVSAIYYLHSLRIMHRDIKPQNILLTLEGVAKLCDFGFSRKMGINTYVLTSIKGTPLYMAPELIEESPYDHTADLWSLGCILFELVTGKPPFNTTSIVQLIKMVRYDPIRWPSNVSLTQDGYSFLNGLLQKEPNKRLTWPAILLHNWVKDGVLVMNNDLDNPLTSPLTNSQQQVKEMQKQQLRVQAMSQPKLIKTLTKQYNNTEGLIPKPHSFHPILNKKKNEFTPIVQEPIVHPPHALKQDNFSTEGQLKIVNNFDLNVDKKCGNLEPAKEQDDDDGMACLEKEVASLLVSEDKLIEEEEWSRFLEKTLVEVLENNLEIFCIETELSMFLTPLQSPSCPVVVIEKVLSLLMMPFVLIETEKELEPVFKVYYNSKVVPNMIFILKAISNSYGQYEVKQISHDDVDIIKEIVMLISHLCHRCNAFVNQFCDTICILNASQLFGSLLFKEIPAEIKCHIICIVNHILRVAPDKKNVVDQMLPSGDTVGSLLGVLIHNSSVKTQVAVCTLIAYGAMHSCTCVSFLQSQSKILHDIVNLERDVNQSVKRAATFALSSLNSFMGFKHTSSVV